MNRYVAIVMLFAVVVAYAVNAEEKNIGLSADEVVTARNVAIKNLEQSRIVSFSLKRGHDDWVKYSLRPAEVRKYRCGDQCDIRLMQTGKPPTVNRLTQTKRYGLYWDNANKTWEIGEAD